MSFENNIKTWVKTDNEIKKLSDKIKELKGERVKIEEIIINHAENNNLSNATIQVNDGKLKFVNSKYTQPLTLKYINECLTNCIENENDMDNKIVLLRSDADGSIDRNRKYLQDLEMQN